MSKILQENLNIFYGYKCNYSCHGCFSGSNVVSDQDLDPDINIILKSIPILAELFEVDSMLTLVGGEPFLYWDDRIVPIVNSLNVHFPNVRINIFTNGQLLEKNIDRVFDLADSVSNFSLTITNHLIGCVDTTPGKIWEAGMQKLKSHPRIVKIHNDHYHILDEINKNIYFYKDEHWKSFYWQTAEGKIKPHATNDPKGSMTHGCTGHASSCTFENKLYKCPNLATLKNHLTTLNQHNDPDWQKYLGCPTIDLFKINEEQLREFAITYRRPTECCDMCNNDPLNNLPWVNRTYPLIFTKKTKVQ